MHQNFAAFLESPKLGASSLPRPLDVSLCSTKPAVLSCSWHFWLERPLLPAGKHAHGINEWLPGRAAMTNSPPSPTMPPARSDLIYETLHFGWQDWIKHGPSMLLQALEIRTEPSKHSLLPSADD